MNISPVALEDMPFEWRERALMMMDVIAEVAPTLAAREAQKAETGGA